MALSSRSGGKTSARIVAKDPILSAPAAPVAPAADQIVDQWAEALRAVSAEFEQADEQQRTATSPATATTATTPSRPANRAVATWRAMPLLVRVMFALDLLMGVLYILSRRLRDVIGKPLRDFLDLNGETNLPSWYSAAQLALIGGVLIAFAASQLRRGARAAWSVMLAGLGFLFLSLDETTSIHEHFGYWLDHLRHRRDTVFAQTGFWMLICAPLFLGGLAIIGWGAWRFLAGRRAIVATLVIGAIVFVAAAAGVESLSNFVDAHGTGARALVLLEEVGEMIGATIMLWGACGLMRSHGVRLLVDDRASGKDADVRAQERPHANRA